MSRAKLLMPLTRNLSYKLYRSHNRTALGKPGRRGCDLDRCQRDETYDRMTGGGTRVRSE